MIERRDPGPDFAWPRHQAAEALAALAVHLHWQSAGRALETTPPATPGDAGAPLDGWLARAAAGLGLEAEAVEASYAGRESALLGGGPALLGLPAGGVLALVGRSGRRLRILTPGGRVLRIAVEPVADLWASTCESSVTGTVDGLLDSSGAQGRRRRRARRVLLAERLAGVRLGNLHLLRLPPGSSFPRQMRRAGLDRALAGFVGTYLMGYLLLLGAWWALGVGVLSGHLVPDALVAWGLLLLGGIPFRVAGVWAMARLAVGFGALLKRRLLVGSLELSSEEVRGQGAGRFLSRVLECEDLEALTRNGGFLALAGGIELALSGTALGFGAGGPMHGGLLALWCLLCLVLGGRLLHLRYAWTVSRLRLTHDLIDGLVGHRTRLAQEDRERWHDGEDRLLAPYHEASRRFDRVKAWLVSAVPRGWLVLGLVGLLPGFLAAGSSRGRLALSVVATLTAYRGFGKLAEGLSHLAGAWIAWREAGTLFHAARRTEIAPAALSALGPRPGATGALLEAVDLSFCHPARDHAVLDRCQLCVEPGARVLIEGSSGSGKSTLAALLAGLAAPRSGLILVDGLDRNSLGPEAWRRQVALAPQFHENHVFTETLAFNLLLGRPWPPSAADLAEAREVCQELGLGDLLVRMPSGLQQIVGESGWQLSHGERSRLYMARALLQGAPTVILDESFAALDPENLDQALDCALRRVPTLLVIAHP